MSDANIFYAVIGLFALSLFISKKMYEKNKDFFDSGQKYRKDWKKWKPHYKRSLHSKITNS